MHTRTHNEPSISLPPHTQVKDSGCWEALLLWALDRLEPHAHFQEPFCFTALLDHITDKSLLTYTLSKGGWVGTTSESCVSHV